MDQKKKTFVINILRRASYKWPSRWIAEKRSKLGRNEYYCESCGIISGKKDTAMDHVLPCVDPQKGFEGFDKYADRMFPDTEFGFQRLCHDCHDIKTTQENGIRKETKAFAKKVPKKKK